MRRALAVVLLAGSLAACGTTVPLAQQGGPGTNGLSVSDGLGATSAPTADVPLSGGQALPSAADSSNGVTSSPVTARPDITAGPGSVPTGVPSSQAAAAANHARIRVGVMYGKGLDKVAGALGISGLTTGDTQAQAAAVVAWINGHGGLGGHPIDPAYYGIDTSQSTNTDELYQQACTALTQDAKVRYVITILNLRPQTLPCFAKAGVGVLDDQAAIGDAMVAKYSAYFAAPGDFAPGRMLTNLVDDLWQRGWLTPKSRIGTFIYDTPDFAALVDGPLTKALAAHGLTIASKQRVPNDAGSVGQAGNVSLQYRAAGVDRVLPVFASPLFLMEAASSQKYYPSYAMYSSFGPGALIEGAAPKDQLKNSAGIGWQPLLDIGSGRHPGPVSSNETLCFDIMKKAGQATTAATAKGFQLQVCNMLFYLKAAATALPSAPRDLLTASRPLLGSGYRPADTFRTDVTNRPDGAAGYRSLAYQTDCACYQYVSAVKASS